MQGLEHRKVANSLIHASVCHNFANIAFSMSKTSVFMPSSIIFPIYKNSELNIKHGIKNRIYLKDKMKPK